MANTPHSDKSGRAARRREEQEVTKAQNTVARAQAQPRPLPTGGGVQISIDDLLRKIGALTVERDAMQLQINQQQEQLANLAKALADTGALEDTEGETPESASEEEIEIPEEGPPTGRTGE